MEKKKQMKGFAIMSPEKRKNISSLGGIMAHKLGRAHKFTSAEARRAGKISGRGRSKTQPI